MSEAENFHDKWESFLIETKGNSESLSEIDAVGGIGSALKKVTGTGARPTDRNISGRTSMVATPEPKSKSKYDGPAPDSNSPSYRGADVQIFTGDLSVAQAFKDIEMDPNDINKILMALKRDLEVEDFDILEKKARQEISLNATIRALNKMPPDSLNSDQRAKVVRVLSNLLQMHRVKLNKSDGVELIDWSRSNISTPLDGDWATAYPEAFDWWQTLPDIEQSRLQKLGQKGMIRAWDAAGRPADQPAPEATIGPETKKYGGAGKGWNFFSGLWVEPTPDTAAALCLAGLADQYIRDRDASIAQEQIQYYQAMADKGAGLLIHIDNNYKPITPKWVEDKDPDWSGSYRMWPGAISDPEDRDQDSPRDFNYSLLAPVSLKSVANKLKGMITADRPYGLAGLTFKKNISPESQAYLKIFIKELEQAPGSLRKARAELPQNNYNEGFEDLQEIYDRWQTITGINKRVL